MRRRLGRIGVVAVLAVACAIGGSAVGYAASKSKPLSSVCVAKKGAHALTAPGKHGCRKGTTRRPLPSSVRGAQGARGATGPTGRPGATSVVRVAASVGVPAAGTSEQNVACPAGTTVTGGGYEISSTSNDVQVYRNMPAVGATGPTGWRVAITNRSAFIVTLLAYALCATS